MQGLMQEHEHVSDSRVSQVVPQRLVEQFRRARSDSSLVVLEGFHALKHALRFGADIVAAVTVDVHALDRLARSLAPELEGRLTAAESVPPEVFRRLTPRPPPTGVVAIASRPSIASRDVLETQVEAPVIFLEAPNDLGNIGAVVRIAAALGAAGVVTTGRHDPWHPTAVRGAAGLHFAVPVVRAEELPACADRALIAIDPAGEAIGPGAIHGGPILAFGTERAGLSPSLLSRAERRLRIPMRRGVSSINLAASVAVVLYSCRLGRGWAGRDEIVDDGP